MSLLLKLEDGKDFLSIHNGGNDHSKMVAKLTGQINDTKIAIPGNQMFVVFHTNDEIVRKGFHALIVESKYIVHIMIMILIKEKFLLMHQFLFHR